MHSTGRSSSPTSLRPTRFKHYLAGPPPQAVLDQQTIIQAVQVINTALKNEVMISNCVTTLLLNLHFKKKEDIYQAISDFVGMPVSD